MKVNRIHITNFRSIKDISFDLTNGIDVLVGVNGAGKSTILDALSISLSWLVNRIQRETSTGQRVSDSDIRMGCDFARIQIFVEEDKHIYSWTLVRTMPGISFAEKSELSEASKLAQIFQKKLADNSKLPVVVYYPVDRVVNSVTPVISNREGIYILDVYENALGGKTNYQSFFEWFRLQDDIINERVGSRQKWIIRNQSWVKKKTKELLKDIEKITIDNYKNNDEFHYFLERFEKNEIIYEEPRYLFHELGELLHLSGRHLSVKYPIDRILKDVEYLMHKMDSFNHFQTDDLIDPGSFPMEIVKKILYQLEEFRLNEGSNLVQKGVVKFIWDALTFAILLSLWWMSNKGKADLERVFRELNPGRFRVAGRNQDIAHELVTSIYAIISQDAKRQYRATSSEGRELKFVTQAIEEFVPEYSNFRVKRLPRPHLLVDKNNITINLDHLSDGEKNLIALVGDLARRLSIANSRSNNPLSGEGIVLIDEIDLHLHPSWQRIMIPKLTQNFPNCQFIFSTHSPQVLSHIRPENIYLLVNHKNELSYSRAIDSYGKNTDRILEDLLMVDARPKDIKNEIHKLYKLIQNDDLAKAKVLLKELNSMIGDDPELTKAKVLIKRKEIIGK